jgi:hypothetical protein
MASKQISKQIRLRGKHGDPIVLTIRLNRKNPSPAAPALSRQVLSR